MLFFKIYDFFWFTKPSNCSATCAVVVSLRTAFWPQLLIYFTGLLSVLVHTTVNKHALKDRHISSPYNDIITAVVNCCIHNAKYCAVDIILFNFFVIFHILAEGSLFPLTWLTATSMIVWQEHYHIAQCICQLEEFCKCITVITVHGLKMGSDLCFRMSSMSNSLGKIARIYLRRQAWQHYYIGPTIKLIFG